VEDATALAAALLRAAETADDPRPLIAAARALLDKGDARRDERTA
jgi:hypothetical protein